ncbi:MAG: Mrp/NBP35 family ATP-binding protein [Henriciella sp.]|nr:Mrp/NBP35 family ATP-binding protein [Henriciella sp.]
MFWDKKDRKAVSGATIRSALGDPNWLSGVRIADDGRVTLIIEADPSDMDSAEKIRLEAEAEAMKIEGVTQVDSVLTAQATPGSKAPPQKTSAPDLKTHSAARRPRGGARLSNNAMSQGQPQRSAPLAPIPGISRILVVASAKGGVGKSTVSVNLAATFAKQGLRVGLLDADIYGPSIPTMLGVSDQSPATNADKKLVPVRAHGIETLSIGYLTDTNAPMIWRGPIVQSAIMQMLNDAAWGSAENPLDLLIIDTPPGTGEAQLTLAQRVPVTAAVIVTTPQEVALADVRRGAAMFEKTHVPVLGIVESMSWFEDPSGARHYLMGEGGGARMAQTLGLPLISQIPMYTEIREGGDLGIPAALKTGPSAEIFQTAAREIALSLDALQTKPAPAIIFED